MRWPVALACGLMASALGLLGAAPALAAPASLAGSYALDPAQSDDIGAAVDRALAPIPGLLRGFVKSRVMATNVAYGSLTISQQGGQVSLACQGLPTVTGPGNGSWFSCPQAQGEPVPGNLQWAPTRLVQTLKFKEYQRVNTFTLRPDGQGLKLGVRLVSPRSSEPTTYTLAYRRR